ncbi:MAG: M48 family metallopeptidase [Burkholderiales bacterium]|nr:M48 family metallopeptidase [Burkholderiales bacterium]
MHPLLRYTLDLFDAAPPSAPAPQGVAGRRRATGNRISKPFVPLAPVDIAQPAIDLIAPSGFAHPKATREVRLGDAVVAYAFTRAKRRTIGFVVGPDGLSVRAPRWTPLSEVDAALQEKGPWILRKLHETRERQTRQHSARIDWCNGVTLPLLGGVVQVVLDPGHHFSAQGAMLDAGALESAPRILRVALPHSAAPEQIRDAVQAWLMRHAKALFVQRLDHFAPQLQVQWKRLSLSNAGTRWGSARIDGSIRLNWRLIHFSQAVIDYVVVHELSHLRVMDHSPRFWDTVRTVVPEYAALRGQLKDDAIPRW